MAISEQPTAEHEALLNFLYMAPVGLVQTALDGTIQMLNPLAANLLLPLQTSARLDNLFHATERLAPELFNLANSFSERRGMICEAYRLRTTTGIRGTSDPHVLEISLMKIDAHRLMAVVTDVTIVVRREEQIKQSSAWFNAIFASANDYAVILLDREGTAMTWNGDAEKLMGFRTSEVIGKPYGILFQDTAACTDRAKDYLLEAKECGWSMQEGWCRRGHGEPFWACSMIATVDTLADTARATIDSDADEGAFALIIRNVSHRRDANLRFRLASTTDHLTGVLNRHAFFDAAESEIKRWKRMPRPLSLLIIDADHFKQINDTLGHPAGDLVLKALAQAIDQATREIDMTARIGGEEFAVLLPFTDMGQALDLAERIRAAVEALVVEIDGHDVRVTISVGIACMSDGMSDLNQLIKCADQALYAAKKLGRNRVVKTLDGDPYQSLPAMHLS